MSTQVTVSGPGALAQTKSQRLLALESRVEAGLLTVASAMSEAYLALCEIRDTGAWKECYAEDGLPAYRTFRDYLSDFRASIASKYPTIPVSYSTIWNTLWALRALGDGLGVSPEVVVNLPEQIRREVRALARWDRETGKPLGLLPEVDERRLPGGNGDPLEKRLRAVVENAAAIAAEHSEREALEYLRNDIRKPAFGSHIKYIIQRSGNRISAIIASVAEFDKDGIETGNKHYWIGADTLPDSVVEDIYRRLGIPYLREEE